MVKVYLTPLMAQVDVKIGGREAEIHIEGLSRCNLAKYGRVPLAEDGSWDAHRRK